MEGRTIRTYGQWCLFFACAWWIVLIPLSYNLFDVVLLPMRSLSGEAAFSDSSGMYRLLLVSIGLGLLSGTLAVLLKLKFDPRHLLHYLLTGFLALILFKYGWIKIIKLQFYLPEPNTLYTRLGFLSKDIAYWSLMGTSRMYVVTTGLIEVIAALLLIFSRTRLIGFMVALAVFANVLLVNLSFDISVKLFSSTLLLFSVIGLIHYKERLGVLIGRTAENPESCSGPSFRYAPVFKALVVTLIVLEGLYPSVFTGNLNDDKQARPWHHGAYAVQGSDQWNALYVHRRGYLILEDKAERQYDFKIDFQSFDKGQVTDERNRRSWPLEWKGDKVVLHAGIADTLRLTKMPYRSLQLLKEAVHPFSDSFH